MHEDDWPPAVGTGVEVHVTKKRWEDVGPPFKKPGWYAAVVVYIDEEADRLDLLFVDAVDEQPAQAARTSFGPGNFEPNDFIQVMINPDNQVALAQAGEIPLLLALLSASDAQKEWAAERLWSLANVNDDNKVAIARAGGIEPLVALARGTDGQKKEEAAVALRNLSCNSTNLAAMKDLGYGKKSFIGGWTVP